MKTANEEKQAKTCQCNCNCECQCVVIDGQCKCDDKAADNCKCENCTC